MLPGLTYPVYTCVCPQSKYTFDVRCLTVAEEDRILQSATFGYQFLHNLNDIIWRCITNKPDDIKTFDDFRKRTTQKDRDALLYSILEASEADEQVLDVQCMSCRETQQVKVQLSKCFSANIYEGNPGELIEKKVPVNVTIGEYDVEFTVIVPTLERERIVMTYIGNRKVSVTLMTMLFSVEKISFKKQDSDNVVEVAEALGDIEVALRSLPRKATTAIRKAILENFSKYTIDLKYKFICSACGSANEHYIDLVEVLFRTVTE